MMHGASETRNPKPTPYATPADFCRIFATQLDHLYLLSYLLTADEARAERCFVRGLETSRGSNPVFKEWAESWARRMIIRNAIQMIGPEPNGADSLAGSLPDAPRRERETSAVEPAEMAAVAALPTFDRFVFVMSVLERYSDQECSLLLSCNRSEVTAARVRALQQLGQAAELRQKLVVMAGEKASRAESAPAIAAAFSPLAASA